MFSKADQLKSTRKDSLWRSKKWRDGAKGQPCTLNLPCCNHDPATTVLAHRNGAGMALKAPDHDAIDACSKCHAALDGACHTCRHRIGRACPTIHKIRNTIFDAARLKTVINRLERKVVK